MTVSVGFFNVNNLFLRYQFDRTYPGDIARTSYTVDRRLGFLPALNTEMFAPFRPEQVELSAAALMGGGLPDILCLCEVENLLALRVFNAIYLGGHYEHALLIDSHDDRLIDVGILSTKEIVHCRSHMERHDEATGKRIFSRDCLEVTLALDDAATQPLTLFITHLKSKFVDARNKTPEQVAAALERTNQFRLLQAEEVRKIVQERFPGEAFGEAWFAVVGDLNDQPDSPWVAPLVREMGLYNVLEELEETDRWTHWWKARNRVSQIDYILLSPALAESVTQAGIKPRIERRGVGIREISATVRVAPQTTRFYRTDDDPDPTRINFEFRRFKQVLNNRVHASDHCPIVVDLPV